MLPLSRKMKKLLVVALALSLAGNCYLAFRLQVQSNSIDAGLHAELMSQWGLRDLSYFLRKSGVTRSQLLDWAKSQPNDPGTERLEPELTDNRFVRFPLEVTFGTSGAIKRITVAGEGY